MRSSVLEYLEIFGKPSDKPKPDKWRPSVEADYKINADGSFVPGQHHAGWGVAVRTADGTLACARAGRQEHINDAFAVKVIAMSHAIHTAADLGIVRVELETDSQLVAGALDMHKVDSSTYAAVIEDMKYQLKLWFSKFTIHVCRRNVNSVAHELANVVRMCEPNHFMEWESDVPAHVGECVLGGLPKHS
ncbi:uncharacterized protein [Aegilops tauschii subsp. strangulata]|uniref:uncharacterized protein n=1 Tax=Aegilops tauschii subsp. strangulata TaxID=200361 RepID=UPI003CC87F26